MRVDHGSATACAYGWVLIVASIAGALGGCAATKGGGGGGAGAARTLSSWPPSERNVYVESERALLAVPTRDSLLRTHQMLADEPHVAGTPGDWRTIEEIAAAFRAMGLETDGSTIDGWNVEIEEFWPLLARPVDARLEVIGAGLEGAALSLELRERPVLGDPGSASADPLVTLAWNAYSGSGDVTAEIVYANYGTKQDFERLRSIGVDCTGKIVIARYGGNYRGYKPKYAEEAGAAGLIIYTDPADTGYTRGAIYPEGGWANDCCIQRGSIVTLGYQGDPLTPGVFASREAARLGVDQVALPRIPVQPIGYGAAMEILKRMSGEALPPEFKDWQGGLGLDYRVTGGPELHVRLMVKQVREVMRTANVIARLEGSGTSAEREQYAIIGCHHDAWVRGAADPTCGTIAMMEAARSFASLAAEGVRPRRSVVFAAWGAEEFGIIGSSEFVEKRRDDLTRNCVGYINLDMASMGPQFGASASPELKTLIAECARVVPAARQSGSESVFDEWLERSQPKPNSTSRSDRGQALHEPPIGDLGGGSDHVPFLMHAGVPSMSFGSGGSAGNSYHSVYDSLPWYWKVVGDDYEPALMITRMASIAAYRLASAPVVPHDVARAYREFAQRARDLDSLAVERGLASRATPEAWGVAGLERVAIASESRATRESRRAFGVEARATGTRWLVEGGVPGRPWYRNWYVATDETSGYANWLLPAARLAIESGDRTGLDAAAAGLLNLVGTSGAD